MDTVKNIGFLLLISLIFSSSAFSIIGGKEVASYGQLPLSHSTVALQLKFLKNDGSIGFRKGSGILIEDNVVLTAGHNVFYQEHPEDIEVIFSEKPCWGQNVCNELRVLATKKIVHPDFSNDYPRPPENDVALLRLASKAPVAFHPIKIVSSNIVTAPFFLYGYGQDKDTIDTPPLSNYLLRELIYSAPTIIELNKSTKFMLAQVKSGFCGGDSGSGLITSKNGIPEVIGIAIHHEPDGGCLTNGYFTDLRYFKDWIESEVNEINSTY